MTQVFISYSHKDSSYVHMLTTDMKWHGFNVWIDDRIDYGSKWPREIEKNLNECEVLIIILSSNSKNSEWVQNELVYAQGMKKMIFPLLLDGDNWLPLAATQYTDVRGGKLPPKEFYENLQRVLKDENPWSKQSSKAWESLGSEPNKADSDIMDTIRKNWNLKGWGDEDDNGKNR